EIMALKGPPVEIKKFADSLQAVRGVKDTKLVMTGLA
ncbi:MAG: nickel-responsive transcriptional regulator NikR, partial [Thermoplasmata archaeon]|nr:nickel-responsive transcriptional regulator NikR [Thermoplasmata archaeon]